MEVAAFMFIFEARTKTTMFTGSKRSRGNGKIVLVNVVEAPFVFRKIELRDTKCCPCICFVCLVASLSLITSCVHSLAYAETNFTKKKSCNSWFVRFISFAGLQFLTTQTQQARSFCLQHKVRNLWEDSPLRKLGTGRLVDGGKEMAEWCAERLVEPRLRLMVRYIVTFQATPSPLRKQFSFVMPRIRTVFCSNQTNRLNFATPPLAT